MSDTKQLSVGEYAKRKQKNEAKRTPGTDVPIAIHQKLISFRIGFLRVAIDSDWP